MKKIAIIMMVLLSNYSCVKKINYAKDKKQIAFILDSCITETKTYDFVVEFDSILLDNYMSKYDKENYLNFTLKIHSTSRNFKIQEYFNYDSLLEYYSPLSQKECLYKWQAFLNKEVFNNLSYLVDFPFLVKVGKISTDD